jgi:hypothetical protein
VGTLRCAETGHVLKFVSGFDMNMVSLDSLFPISQMKGDAIGQEWRPVSHAFQRFEDSFHA